MCLVIYLPKGKDKTDSFIEEAIRKASEFNADGMGYSIKRADNSLYIKKGFFDVDEFIKDFNDQNILEEDEALIHLRIGNKGAIDPSMCHPFIISNDEEEIITLEGFTDKPIVMHNGTMTRHAVVNSDKSDTFFFIKNVLSKQPVINFMREDINVFNYVMQPHLLTSRLAVMYPDDHNTALIGTWHEIKGLYFSKDYNVEYFPKKTNYATSYNSSSDWWKEYKKGNYTNSYDDEWDDDLFIHVNDKNKKKSTKLLNLNSKVKSNIIDIPELAYPRAYFKDGFGYKHTLYMGLYLPEEEGLRNYTVELNNTNCEDAYLDLIHTDYQIGLYNHMRYKAVSVNLHNITVACSDGYNIDMSIKDFYESFRVSFIGNDSEYYNEYFKLVRDFTVSKNLYKKIQEAVDKADANKVDTINFKYFDKRIKDVDSILASEFLLNMEEELEIRKFPERLLF